MKNLDRLLTNSLYVLQTEENNIAVCQTQKSGSSEPCSALPVFTSLRTARRYQKRAQGSHAPRKLDQPNDLRRILHGLHARVPEILLNPEIAAKGQCCLEAAFPLAEVLEALGSDITWNYPLYTVWCDGGFKALPAHDAQGSALGLLPLYSDRTAAIRFGEMFGAGAILYRIEGHCALGKWLAMLDSQVHAVAFDPLEPPPPDEVGHRREWVVRACEVAARYRESQGPPTNEAPWPIPEFDLEYPVFALRHGNGYLSIDMEKVSAAIPILGKGLPVFRQEALARAYLNRGDPFAVASCEVKPFANSSQLRSLLRGIHSECQWVLFDIRQDPAGNFSTQETYSVELLLNEVLPEPLVQFEFPVFILRHRAGYVTVNAAMPGQTGLVQLICLFSDDDLAERGLRNSPPGCECHVLRDKTSFSEWVNTLDPAYAGVVVDPPEPSRGGPMNRWLSRKSLSEIANFRL